MSVGRICTREVHVAEADESALAAARRMAERRVGTLLVLDGEKRPTGILTDRDLVVRVLAAGREASTTPVRDVMTAKPKVVPEGNSIEGALALMRSGGFRRLPVVDGEGRLAGILTLDDVLALLAEEAAAIGTLVETRRG